ncbi:hypothetical protein C8F01DRAFT_641704 [Mycena amicta]|nr:hypothetical protein C8F01DRAFT_641704 [Mycena amicta]
MPGLPVSPAVFLVAAPFFVPPVGGGATEFGLGAGAGECDRCCSSVAGGFLGAFEARWSLLSTVDGPGGSRWVLCGLSGGRVSSSRNGRPRSVS